MIQDLGQYDSWHRVNRQEECLMEEGEDSSIEGSPTVGDGGRAAISLTPDVVGTGSGSLLDSILSTLLLPDTQIKIPYYCTLYSTVQ